MGKQLKRAIASMGGQRMKYYSDVESNDAARVDQAIQLIKQNQLDQARGLLQEIVKQAPEDYVYSFEEDGQQSIKFWDHDEFVHYCKALEGKQERPKVIWLASAYPRAYFYLAYLEVQEGQYENALSYLEASLKLEPDQPLTYCELALVYSQLGQPEQAMALYNRALQLCFHADVPAHPAFTHAAHNLAELYSALGRFDKAEPLLNRALEITEKTRGPEHPDLLDSLSGLAVLNHRQGRYAEAEQLYERLIKLFIQTLGSDHPQFAEILSNLAGLYTDQGKYDEAEMLYQQALEIFENTLGPNHPAVQRTLNMLLDLCKRQERFAEAVQYYNRLIGYSLEH